jgi:leucine dehydrogenase
MSSVLEEAARRGHEETCFFSDSKSGLKAIISVHNTSLGAAIGGCRMRAYTSEWEAIDDVLRLSEGMTYKNALAGIPHGGAKACILVPADAKLDRRAIFTKFGECVNRLSGRYWTAEDMGTSVEDLMVVHEVSRYVVGTDPKKGGGGDPSPWTAKGVFNSILAACEYKFSDLDLSKRKVAVQGVGHVGAYLVERLVEAGAKVVICDTNAQNIERVRQKYKVEVVEPDAIYDQAVDIFAPCAIGQTINSRTVPRLKATLIVGAANNQLSDPGVYSLLSSRGILYCPDFVVNAGGVICVAGECRPDGWQEPQVAGLVDKIPTTLKNVLEEAEKNREFPEVVALRMARERVSSAVLTNF